MAGFWDVLEKITATGKTLQGMWDSVAKAEETLSNFGAPVPIHQIPPSMTMPPAMPVPPPIPLADASGDTVPLVIGAIAITLVFVLIVYGLCSCANLSLLIIKTNIVTLPVNIAVTLFILLMYHSRYGASSTVPPVYHHPPQGYQNPYGYQDAQRHH